MSVTQIKSIFFFKFKKKSFSLKNIMVGQTPDVNIITDQMVACYFMHLEGFYFCPEFKEEYSPYIVISKRQKGSSSAEHYKFLGIFNLRSDNLEAFLFPPFPLRRRRHPIHASAKRDTDDSSPF